MVHDAPADATQSSQEDRESFDLAGDGLIAAAWREEFGRDLTWPELAAWLGEAG